MVVEERRGDSGGVEVEDDSAEECIGWVRDSGGGDEIGVVLVSLLESVAGTKI